MTATTPRRRPRARKNPRSRQGVGITKVGLWYTLFAVIVGIAATNTGNNALYLVVAAMLGLLISCWWIARANGSRIDVSIELPGEVFADANAEAQIEVSHRGRFLPRRQLVVRVHGQEPRVIQRLSRRPWRPRLPTSGARARAIEERRPSSARRSGSLDGNPAVARMRCEIGFARRGVQPLPATEVMSLFPLGLFRSVRSSHRAGDVVVYPSLLRQPMIRFRKPGELGADSTRRGGWGHDLHALRPFRSGDDPRSIHWKQSARVGDLIYKEHEAEESRRLAIVLDEGILDGGEGPNDRAAEDGSRHGEGPGIVDALVSKSRMSKSKMSKSMISNEFEQLVREAATAGLDYLERGFEVELVTRGCRIPFATGPRQRYELLECLALVEPCPRGERRLESSDRSAPELRLTMDQTAPRDSEAPPFASLSAKAAS